MRKAKRIRRGIREKIAQSSEFPIECVSGIPVVEIKGIHEAYVSGCDRILEYCPELVIFDAGKYLIIINGECMVLSDFTSGCIEIEGVIEGVKLEMRERGK